MLHVSTASGRARQVGGSGCWRDRQEGWIKGQACCYSLGNEVQGASGRENGKIKERRKLVKRRSGPGPVCGVGGPAVRGEKASMGRQGWVSSHEGKGRPGQVGQGRKGERA